MLATLGLSSLQLEVLSGLAIRLSEIPGVGAVVLGGSYARGTARADSDLDLGVYYSEHSLPDVDAVRHCAELFSTPSQPPTVTGFYAWGPWVNGGAWIRTAAGKVDLLYRNTDQVRRVLKAGHQGIHQHDFYQQPTFGFTSLVYFAETKCCLPLFDRQDLVSELKSRVEIYPAPLQGKVISDSLAIAEFTFLHAQGFALRGDTPGSELDGFSTACSRCAVRPCRTKHYTGRVAILYSRTPIMNRSTDLGWQPLRRGQVTIQDGFWQRWRDLIGETTLAHEFEEMRADGHMDAMLLDPRMHRGRALADPWAEAGYWGGSVFWDSDLAKWLEAASARLEQTPDPALEARVNEIIGLFERAQRSDGYVNSHILTWRPQHRFKNLRDLHELYCAGHLIEAAVVHSEATGQDRLLQVAKRFADHLMAHFGREPGQIRGYCGHPEIELALLRLYHATKERRYLDLCRYFINERGQSPNFFEQEAAARLDTRPFRRNHPGSPYAYMQAHEPIRVQTQVVGHAVRAMYLFAAAAGLALEDGDDDLLATCERIWQDVIKTKLYITGGIGSASENEGFTRDYDLPNHKAYAETCASIGLFLFGHRLLQARLHSQYGDIMEVALYNNILSGVSLDGRSFFYDNPLAADGSHRRVRWPWWCPCCPPNLARLISSLSGYLYSERQDSIAIHQYVSSEAHKDGFTLRVRSGLPYAGNNTVEIQTEVPVERTLFFRIPGWAARHTITINGTEVMPRMEDGYAVVRRTWASGDRIELDFELQVRMKFCRFEVDANRGRVALTRGPLVYCLEQVDNGADLDAMTLTLDAAFAPEVLSDLPDGMLALAGPGFREQSRNDGLYSNEPAVAHPTAVTAVPYYAWGNREPGEMQVWIRRAMR